MLNLVCSVLIKTMVTALPFIAVWAVVRTAMLVWHKKSSRPVDIGREVWVFLFGLYIICLYVITVYRDGISLAGIFHRADVLAKINLIPFKGYLAMIDSGSYQEFIYLFFGNMLWFLPFGFMLPLVSRKKQSLSRIALYTFLLSLSVELLQFLFGTGFTEADDLLLNTAGGIAGYGIYKAIMKLWNH